MKTELDLWTNGFNNPTGLGFVDTRYRLIAMASRRQHLNRCTDAAWVSLAKKYEMAIRQFVEAMESKL